MPDSLTHSCACMAIRLQRASEKVAMFEGFAMILRAWGARGRVFESLRPDHILKGDQVLRCLIPFLVSGLRKTGAKCAQNYPVI